jgi:hypothetical protein
MSNVGRILIIGALGSLATSAAARDIVPEQTGFGGFFQLGYAYTGIENNEIAGVGFGNYDEITNSKIGSLNDSPDEVTEGIPSANFKFSYTLESRTEFFLGRELLDAVRFDFSNQLGVRQEFGDKSNVTLAYVFSGIPTKVWSDPFVEGRTRNPTDREANGFRLGYSSILGSNFDVQYTVREIDIDRERSGTFLGLTSGQRKQLRRDGDQHNLRFGYLFDLGDKDSLYPELIYINDDRDGEAMSGEQWGLQVTYVNVGDRFNMGLTANYSTGEYDKKNPVYGKKRDDDSWGVGVSLFDKKLLRGLGNKWLATVTAGYYEADSNIDFYDSTLWTVGLGVMYRF